MRGRAGSRVLLLLLRWRARARADAMRAAGAPSGHAAWFTVKIATPGGGRNGRANLPVPPCRAHVALAAVHAAASAGTCPTNAAGPVAISIVAAIAVTTTAPAAAAAVPRARLRR